MKFCSVIFLGFMLTNNLCAMFGLSHVVVHSVNSILHEAATVVECLAAQPNFDQKRKDADCVLKVLPYKALVSLQDTSFRDLLTTLSRNAKIHHGTCWCLRSWSSLMDSKGEALPSGIALMMVDENGNLNGLNNPGKYFQAVMTSLCTGWSVIARDNPLALRLSVAGEVDDYYYLIKEQAVNNDFDILIDRFVSMLKFPDKMVCTNKQFERDSQKYYVSLAVKKNFWQTFNVAFGLCVNPVVSVASKKS